MTVREREVTQRGDPVQRRPSFLAVALWCLTLAIAVLTAVGFAASLGWAADLSGAFRPHYALVGVVCLIGMAVARRWTGVLIAAGVVAANVAVVAPLWLEAPASAPAGSPTFTVLWHNINDVKESRAEDLIDEIMSADADVVFLAQVNPRVSRALQRSEELVHDTVSTHGRSLVLARVPVTNARPVNALPRRSRDAAVALHAAVLPDRSVAMLGIHTLSPRTPVGAGVRNAELAVAASWAGAQEGPTVLVGDLNTPPWSVPFRALARFGGLVDSLRGHGLQPTWPANWGLASVPIDHALHSPDLAVVSRTTGPSLGSAHSSVRVTFAPAASPAALWWPD